MKKFKWTIIGSGPAGITTIGKLLDMGVTPADILWIDPAFTVGDLGNKWSSVSSNTKVQQFQMFLNEFKSFNYATLSRQFQFKINTAKLNSTCLLQNIITPLQEITKHLCTQVVPILSCVQQITFNNIWQIQLDNLDSYYSEKIILAIGSDEKNLNLPNLHNIPLQIALNKQLLSNAIDKNDCVAVFGSSHSAIIIIRNLIELGTSQIINFYRSPLCYAVEFDNWILFDNTGLKGGTATWARDNLHNTAMHKNLIRVNINDKNTHLTDLGKCNKIIYAIGFERRKLKIEGINKLEYNPHNGIIAPGLFGFGIAFPELHTDPYGHTEYNVGLWKFATYINKVMPIWERY